MSVGLLQSSPIERLAPTSSEVLHECPLRYSFAQASAPGTFRGTPATRLGTIAHNVLDTAVRERLLWREDWRNELEKVWDTEAHAEEVRAAAAGVADPANRWPGYQLKRARLFQVAGRVRSHLEDLPAGAEVLTEVALSAADGLLHGRADLIIRSPACHQIIDYKSGGVLDRETSQPHAAYVRQLQLYAFLEHASSGSWPTSAHLFPLHGLPVEIDVHPQTCERLAHEALSALAAYNSLVPGEQPARPSPEHCRWCPAAAGCTAFWDTCDDSWVTDVRAVAGCVTARFDTALAGMTISLAPRAGTLGAETVVVKNLDTSVHPNAAAIEVGDDVALVGLIVDSASRAYRLADTAALTRVGSADSPE